MHCSCMILLVFFIGYYIEANPRFSRQSDPQNSEEEPVPMSSEEAFSLTDRDKDGMISFKEFILGDPGVFDDFRITDENQDRLISKVEFKIYYDFLKTMELEEEQPLEGQDVLFSNADMDKDGKLTFPEFLKMDEKYVSGMQAHFKEMDKNNSNFLELEEFKLFFAHLLEMKFEEMAEE